MNAERRWQMMLDEADRMPPPAIADQRPDLNDLLAASHAEGEVPPGVAIVAWAAAWVREHWPALVLGFATGLVAIAVPALVAAQLVS